MDRCAQIIDCFCTRLARWPCGILCTGMQIRYGSPPPPPSSSTHWQAYGSTSRADYRQTILQGRNGSGYPAGQVDTRGREAASSARRIRAGGEKSQGGAARQVATGRGRAGVRSMQTYLQGEMLCALSPNQQRRQFTPGCAKSSTENSCCPCSVAESKGQQHCFNFSRKLLTFQFRRGHF